MSKLVPQAVRESVVKKASLSIKDTDFLLKLILKSTFEGSELEVAFRVMEKLATMHKGYLDETDSR
ncbi:hypothetical protein CMI47_07010 [Candidatus Pacearchaeota archaeon]|jgi:hypothetical protein|nr:hypothetical protein [Candidatus Pacearchaeota archaeon]MDP6585729.1 hypothetical protein [Anaerolineales bacterium]|tara:strand:- start:201 stop:398 length:198 start_codon:yes stop_codon:yes gene_type:complete